MPAAGHTVLVAQEAGQLPVRLFSQAEMVGMPGILQAQVAVAVAALPDQMAPGIQEEVVLQQVHQEAVAVVEMVAEAERMVPAPQARMVQMEEMVTAAPVEVLVEQQTVVAVRLGPVVELLAGRVVPAVQDLQEDSEHQVLIWPVALLVLAAAVAEAAAQAERKDKEITAA